MRLRRAFWLGMVALHAPAWVAATGLLVPSGWGLLRYALLTLSMLFFGLKLLDVRWLRAPAGRQAWIAMMLAIALLHAGVVQRLDASDSLADMIRALPAGASITIALIGLAWAVRRLSQPRGVSPARQFGWRARPIWENFLSDFLPPRNLLLARACLVNRAPPR